MYTRPLPRIIVCSLLNICLTSWCGWPNDPNLFSPEKWFQYAVVLDIGILQKVFAVSQHTLFTWYTRQKIRFPSLKAGPGCSLFLHPDSERAALCELNVRAGLVLESALKWKIEHNRHLGLTNRQKTFKLTKWLFQTKIRILLCFKPREAESLRKHFASQKTGMMARRLLCGIVCCFYVCSHTRETRRRKVFFGPWTQAVYSLDTQLRSGENSRFVLLGHDSFSAKSPHVGWHSDKRKAGRKYRALRVHSVLCSLVFEIPNETFWTLKPRLNMRPLWRIGGGWNSDLGGPLVSGQKCRLQMSATRESEKNTGSQN